MVVVIALVLVTALLFIVVRLGVVSDSTLQQLANVAAVGALIAASLVFLVPTPPSQDREGAIANLRQTPASEEDGEGYSGGADALPSPTTEVWTSTVTPLPSATVTPAPTEIPTITPVPTATDMPTPVPTIVVPTATTAPSPTLIPVSVTPFIKVQSFSPIQEELRSHPRVLYSLATDYALPDEVGTIVVESRSYSDPHCRDLILIDAVSTTIVSGDKNFINTEIVLEQGKVGPYHTYRSLLYDSAGNQLAVEERNFDDCREFNSNPW